ncbi:hypothetical protein BJY52DRAFT_1413439 [Lactarius psammicola]|nr:hypothetical protein BJY52DRAFT_1413439 [Lactarius psammicola]
MNILDRLLSIYREGRPLATEIVQIVRGWGNNSLSLAVLIHVTRQQINHYDKPSWPAPDFFYVLEAASEFDVLDTSLELQHEFCALWNQIALKVHNNNNGRMVALTLRPIRHIYIALHRDTDSAPTQFSPSTHFMDKILWEPSSYPVCKVAGHIHDDSAPTIFAHTVPHDSATPVPVPLSNPDAPSSSVPAPLPVVESLTDVPPLDNSQRAHQITTESPRIPVTSPDPAAAGAIQDIVASGIHHTPETPTFVPPLSSTSQQRRPPDASRSVKPPISAPDLGAAAEGDGSPKPGLRKEKDAPDPPSVIRAIHANTMTTVDLPPQSPPLISVTNSDIAIVGTKP